MHKINDNSIDNLPQVPSPPTTWAPWQHPPAALQCSSEPPRFLQAPRSPSHHCSISLAEYSLTDIILFPHLTSNSPSPRCRSYPSCHPPHSRSHLCSPPPSPWLPCPASSFSHHFRGSLSLVWNKLTSGIGGWQSLWSLFGRDQECFFCSFRKSKLL